MLPSINDRNYAFIALSCNAKKSWRGHVKVLVRGIAPPSVVVRGAEVGGGNHNGTALKAPLGIDPVVADHLVTSPACLPSSEKCAAHCCCVHSKPRIEGVVITTSTPYMYIYFVSPSIHNVIYTLIK